MSTMSVTYRGPSAKFAALNSFELADSLRNRFNNWVVEHRSYNRYTKKAIEFGGGTVSYIQLTGPELRLANGEQTKARITIVDQDFAGRALTVQFGLYRLVCTNGLMAWSHVATPIRIPHTKNKTELLMQLDSIIESSAQVFDQIVAEANRLLTTVISNPVQVIERLATNSQVGTKLPKRVVEQVINMIRTNTVRSSDDPATAWGLYNIINEVDRTKARAKSVLYLQRDTELVNAILAVA